MRVKKWIDKYLPSDLSGDTFLITGGNSGIGFELAKIIASLNGKLILAVRNMDTRRDDHRWAEALRGEDRERPEALRL